MTSNIQDKLSIFFDVDNNMEGTRQVEWSFLIFIHKLSGKEQKLHGMMVLSQKHSPLCVCVLLLNPIGDYQTYMRKLSALILYLCCIN